MHPSTALATVLVDELVRGGVREAVLSPGSRSAPLAYALEEADRAGRLRLHVRVDERSAGFLALGLAKASGLPVPVVTTSGTAVANLHPAALEAHHSCIPLMILSADRPAELRGTGANQTTVQPGMFGETLRWQADLPAPERRPGQVPHWRSTVCRALAAALGQPSVDGWARSGPVHLNVSMRDPLAPALDDVDGWPDDLDGRPDGAPWTEVVRGGGAEVLPVDGGEAVRDRRSAAGPPSPIEAGRRTVVLLGDLRTPDLALRAVEWARQAGWPVLAEPFGALPVGEGVVPHGVLVAGRVARGGAPAELVPERVVVVGRLTLFRELAALSRLPGVRVEQVTVLPQWTDPGHVMHRVHGVGALASPPERADGARDWVESWVGAGRVLGQAVGEAAGLAGDAAPMTGAGVAATVAEALRPDDVLVLGSSSAPRDLALALDPATVAPARVIASRGLAGIDGTVSTAIGVALAQEAEGPEDGSAEHLGEPLLGGVEHRGEPGGGSAEHRGQPGGGSAEHRTGRTIALLGDLTFLHDTNGLLIGPTEPLPDITFVVVNDDGGGIFSTLEYGEPARSASEVSAAATERIFGTPHGTDLAALCAAHHVAYRVVDSLSHLKDLLDEPVDGVRVLEVPVDRASHRMLRERLR